MRNTCSVTPFIAIFRDLEKNEKLDGNRLLFSNQTEDDVILAGEFKRLFGDDALYTVTEEDSATYESGRIDKDFLRKHVDDFDQHFYVCGPPAMVDDVIGQLKDLGADDDKIVREEAA